MLSLLTKKILLLCYGSKVVFSLCDQRPLKISLNRLKKNSDAMSESPCRIPLQARKAINTSVLESTHLTQVEGTVESHRLSSAGSTDAFSPSTTASPPVVEVQLDPLSPRAIMLKDIEKMESLFEDGYDSDRMSGPWHDMEKEEGIQDFDEDEIGQESPTCPPTACGNTKPSKNSNNESINSNSTTNDSPAPPPENIHVPIPDEVLEKYKIADLKKELRSRKLPVKGNKKTLLKCLKDGLKRMVPVIGDGNVDSRFSNTNKKKKNEEKNDSDDLKIFSKDAYWAELFQLEDIVDEPDNPTFSNPRAPTIEEKGANFIPEKHNFAEVFDRQVFFWKGKSHVF